MADRRTRRLLGGVIVVVGAVLLLAALLSPWYTYQTIVSSGTVVTGTVTINSYPGLPTQNGTIQCSGSGNVRCTFVETSYRNADENNTGVIAEEGCLLLIIGFFLGLVGGVLGLASRRDPRRVRPALALGVIAAIIAVLTPMLFWATLPGALSKDIPTTERITTSGPWASFFGSTIFAPFVSYSEKFTWGPAFGWYLSFVALAVLLVGTVLLFLNRKDPAEPTPADAPMPIASPTPAPQSAQAVPE